MNVKKLTVKQIKAIYDNTSLTFTNTIWQQLLQKPFAQLAVHTYFDKLAEDIWSVTR